ncbi:hypothetical protein [Pseudonocardia sp. NPDC049635]|uniref:hypothetical protein n=1 Tax=Pseudonocardia sp. NPDC049635 TaxID=3155506 RepID=UPI0033EA9355
MPDDAGVPIGEVTSGVLSRPWATPIATALVGRALSGPGTALAELPFPTRPD